MNLAVYACKMDQWEETRGGRKEKCMASIKALDSLDLFWEIVERMKLEKNTHSEMHWA